MTQYALPTMKTLKTRFRLRWLNAPPIRSRGGGVQVVTYGSAFWECLISTPDSLKSEEVLALQAWFDKLEGGLHAFLAHDEALPWPRTYPLGFAAAGLLKQDNVTPFTGAATLSAIAARTMTITALPDDFALKVGDYVGLVQSSRYSLHRVVGDVTANASGVATAVPVVPPVNTNLFTTGAAVNLERPLAEFVPDPDTWSGDSYLRMVPGVGVSFGGISRVA